MACSITRFIMRCPSIWDVGRGLAKKDLWVSSVARRLFEIPPTSRGVSRPLFSAYKQRLRHSPLPSARIAHTLKKKSLPSNSVSILWNIGSLLACVSLAHLHHFDPTAMLYATCGELIKKGPDGMSALERDFRLYLDEINQQSGSEGVCLVILTMLADSSICPFYEEFLSPSDKRLLHRAYLSCSGEPEGEKISDLDAKELVSLAQKIIHQVGEGIVQKILKQMREGHLPRDVPLHPLFFSICSPGPTDDPYAIVIEGADCQQITGEKPGASLTNEDKLVLKTIYSLFFLAVCWSCFDMEKMKRRTEQPGKLLSV